MRNSICGYLTAVSRTVNFHSGDTKIVIQFFRMSVEMYLWYLILFTNANLKLYSVPVRDIICVI